MQTMPSYREIDYTIRPAKAVERKMMIEAFRRLSAGWSIETYRYIGMGSVYFADFHLVHEQLGISDMLSLELDGAPTVRFEFNKPFACIKMLYRKRGQPLPEIPWNKPAIVWFDYDGKLDSFSIADVRTAFQHAVSGSLICVSFNAEADKAPTDVPPSSLDEWRLQQFSEAVGPDNLPHGLEGRRLRAKELPDVVYEVLSGAIADQLAKRNGRPDTRPETIVVKQILRFQYADNAQMMTIGWFIHSVADLGLASRCDFKALPFMRDGSESFNIRAPKLTKKEVRYLASKLPHGNPEQTFSPNDLQNSTGVPAGDIEKFRSVYRYYPSYSEVSGL